MDFDFASLLWPVEPVSFFRDHWEKQPLVVSRNQSDYYSRLFSRADLDAVITFTRPTFVGSAPEEWQAQRKNVVRGGVRGPGDFSLESGPDLIGLRQAYAQGKTILIDGLQQRWQPVAAFCRNLEALFHHPFHANMYLTPRGSQGFSAHFDGHDVFIVQIEGSKHWRLYGPIQELPLHGGARVLPQPLGPPLQEVCLNAGDLLYIPRGHGHEAFTEDCSSLHLTVGVCVFRWADLLNSALACVSRRDGSFRSALPIGFLDAGDEPASLQQQFRELLKRLADDAQVEEAVEHLGSHFLSQLPALPDGHFVPTEDLDRVGLDTVLARPAGVICRVVQEADRVGIQFPGNLVKGPRGIGPALHFIALAAEFTARSLPGELSDQAKLVLLRRLIREGLLKVVPPRDPPPNGQAGRGSTKTADALGR